MDHDLRRRGQDVVKEGFYLMSLMPTQAILIKFLEALVWGYLGAWTATMVGWKLFAAAFLSLAEVYFMAVWLVFYFAARCEDGELIGRQFGARDLEDCLNGLR
ncbi:hypothetical protein MUK42_18705 [Musa troglodytarum]|nr:hypothetical protein MUK42_18705 [Musa troglodytarum]